jgi:hypothetical protein
MSVTVGPDKVSVLVLDDFLQLIKQKEKTQEINTKGIIFFTIIGQDFMG